MRCSRCGAENPPGKRFCGDCGSALENRCPQCGADNLAGKRYCADCGAALTAVRAVQLSSPAQPPPELHVATTIGNAATPTEGERRHLTVLFSDLVNSTEIAGHLDPEDWHDIAAEYQRTAAAAASRFGGHVAKYLGDGLMVYFGWPQAHEDDAERAVRAAVAIVESGDGELPVRVGIEAGELVVGVCQAIRPERHQHPIDELTGAVLIDGGDEPVERHRGVGDALLSHDTPPCSGVELTQHRADEAGS